MTITIDEVYNVVLFSGCENINREIVAKITDAMCSTPFDENADVSVIVELMYVSISRDIDYGFNIHDALKEIFPRGSWQCYVRDGANLGKFLVTYEAYKEVLNEYWRVRLGM